MAFLRLIQLLEAVTVPIVMVYFAHKGFRRRRAHWMRGSWIRFALTIAASVVALSIPLGAELAIDFGYHWRDGMSRDARGLYAIGMVALMGFGATLLAITLGWFAQGEPTRQFPGAKATSGARSV